MKINCYHNKGFPIIATASRDDLETYSDRDVRYPLIHAILVSKDVLDEITGEEKNLIFVEFQELRKETDTDELVSEIRNELIKFITKEFHNDFLFFFENEFYKCSDMRETMLKKEFFLLSMKMKLI